MSYLQLRRGVFVLLSLVLGTGCIMSQDSLLTIDTAMIVGATKSPAIHEHKLNLGTVIASASIVTVSALTVNNGWLSNVRDHVQDKLSNHGKDKTEIDAYLQYVPMTVPYVLDLCKVRPNHELKDRTIILAMSYVTMGFFVNTMKPLFKEKRPDTHARNSFPSGHTATAFMGAEFLFQEYKGKNTWIGYTGYAMAALTGYLRIYNDRHYLNDVLAGACIGIISTKLSYWLYPKIFKSAQCNKPLYEVLIHTNPWIDEHSIGLSCRLSL